ncbi:hypothetical protein M2403_001667 [Rahnella sp. BIGb0603]|nr:hypothetical protein [Rahnella sp. BIGb0603]
MGKQLVIAALALLAAFAAGWQVNAWYSDSLELVISNVAHAAGEASRVAGERVASESGRRLEEKLEALRDAQPTEIRTEILKPVFINECLSAEFVSLYNTAADKAERALSGKSVNQMPDKTPAH